jgi:aspartate ammonia-lyase
MNAFSPIFTYCFSENIVDRDTKLSKLSKQSISTVNQNTRLCRDRVFDFYAYAVLKTDFGKHGWRSARFSPL